jgi:hypothetical protein
MTTHCSASSQPGIRQRGGSCICGSRSFPLVLNTSMMPFMFSTRTALGAAVLGTGATWGIGALAHTAKLGWSASTIPLRVTTSLSAIGTQAFLKARWLWCEAPHQG